MLPFCCDSRYVAFVHKTSNWHCSRRLDRHINCFGLLYSSSSVLLQAGRTSTRVRNWLGHVSVDHQTATPSWNWRRKRKPSVAVNPNQRNSEALVHRQGSADFFKECLTRDQLCGGRAGASSASCWFCERTPHNGDRNKTVRYGESL